MGNTVLSFWISLPKYLHRGENISYYFPSVDLLVSKGLPLVSSFSRLLIKSSLCCVWECICQILSSLIKTDQWLLLLGGANSVWLHKSSFHVIPGKINTNFLPRPSWPCKNSFYLPWGLQCLLSSVRSTTECPTAPLLWEQTWLWTVQDMVLGVLFDLPSGKCSPKCVCHKKYYSFSSLSFPRLGSIH